PEQARNALGIGASLAGGLLRNTGTMTKPMHAGNGARNGVIATLLAKRGFTANQEILEGKGGYCFMFGNAESTGLDGADADLGEDWQLGRIGLGLKPYPICRSTHASIDAMLTLRKEHGLRPEDVEEIICRICPIHTQFCRFHRPQTAYEGKFSITYALATALRNGKIAISDFADEKVTEPAVREVLEKVRFEYPEGWGKGAVDLRTEITVRLKNGEAFACEVPLPRGEPENPMTDAELDGKFTDCGRLVLEEKEVKQALDMVRHIEEVDDLSVLWQLLNKGN
ncbi:MAG: MmgE/PrpD family protein, partial [Chloroflexota bacterium]